MQTPPPLLTAPKRVYVYIAMLFGLPLLYVIGGISSSGSNLPIIRELQTLRLVVFGLCAVGFATAGILFLKRKSSGRAVVIAALSVHFAYILSYMSRLFFQSDSPDALEMAGVVFGLTMFTVCFVAFGAIPFTRKFSMYLGRTRT